MRMSPSASAARPTGAFDTQAPTHASQIMPFSVSVQSYDMQQALPVTPSGEPPVIKSSHAAPEMQAKDDRVHAEQELKPCGGVDHFDPNAGHVFMDAATVKQKLLSDMLSAKKYDVTNCYHDTGCIQRVARSPIFEGFTLFVIAVNAVWIGVDTDYNNSEVLVDAQLPFQIMENVFCLYFTGELLIRFLAFKRKFDCLCDAWFVFDSLLVLTMVSETWIMSVILLMTGSSGSGVGNASFIRLFRLLRLTRMARMARLLRSFPELLILIKGMLAAFRSVSCTLILLIIVVYVYGILFTQLTEGEIHEEYFDTVLGAMHSLIVYGTFLDDLASLVFVLEKESLIQLTLFYSFVLLSALTVMNMLIGVLCEVVSGVAAAEGEESTIKYVHQLFEDLLAQSGADEDGNNMISKNEFISILHKPQAYQALESVNVDVMGLLDLTDFLFASEAATDEAPAHSADATNFTVSYVEKELSFKQFMDIVLSLRGTNNATVKDIVDLRKYVHKESQVTHKRMAVLESRLSKKLFDGQSYKVTGSTSLPTELDLSYGARVTPGTGGSVDFEAAHGAIASGAAKPAQDAAAPASGQAALLGHTSQSAQQTAQYSQTGTLEKVHSMTSVQEIAPFGSPRRPQSHCERDDLLLAKTAWLEQVLTTGHSELKRYLESAMPSQCRSTQGASETGATHTPGTWTAVPGAIIESYDDRGDVSTPASSRPTTRSAPRSLQLEPLELAAVATMSSAMEAGLMALKQVQTRVSGVSAPHAWTLQHPNMQGSC